MPQNTHQMDSLLSQIVPSQRPASNLFETSEPSLQKTCLLQKNSIRFILLKIINLLLCKLLFLLLRQFSSLSRRDIQHITETHCATVPVNSYYLSLLSNLGPKGHSSFLSAVNTLVAPMGTHIPDNNKSHQSLQIATLSLESAVQNHNAEIPGYSPSRIRG